MLNHIVHDACSACAARTVRTPVPQRPAALPTALSALRIEIVLNAREAAWSAMEFSADAFIQYAMTTVRILIYYHR